MLKKLTFVSLTVLLLLGFGQQAHAVLSTVGPTNPGNGFPTFYQDTKGVSLSPCLSTQLSAGPGGAFMCVLLADPGYDPALPIVFPSNFPLEFFYWMADAVGLGPNVKVMRFALEGTFATPTVTQGSQLVFTRIRIKITPPNPNANYTVSHPFGTRVLTPADLKLGFFLFTEDIPILAPLNFTAAVNGNIGPFLAWDPAVAPAAPLGFIGDPGISHQVVGSPIGRNFVRVDGPNIGGPGINTVQTSLFSISGQQFTGVLPSPLSVKASTYSRTTAGEVDVYASSAPTATVNVSGGATPPAGPQAMTGDGLGNFFARLVMPDATTLPGFVNISASTPPNTPTVLASALHDIVTISRAMYDLSTNTLTVTASSTDKSTIAAPTLTAVGLGSLVAGTFVASGVLAPPPTVKVVSSAGGSDTVPVTVTGGSAGLPPVAVNDTVSTKLNTPVTINVRANDTGVLLPPGTVTIVAAPLSGAVVVNPASTVTYTPNVGFSGTDSFTYTVTGPGGVSNVATVTVNVVPATDTVTITRARYTASTGIWAISGTTSLPGATITVYNSGNLAPPILGSAVATAGGLWCVRAVGSGITPNPANVVSARSTGGGTALNATITVR